MLTLSSTYIKKKGMPLAAAQELTNDITIWGTMVHTMVRDIQHPKDDPESLHRQYKRIGLTDYMVTSLEGVAKGIVDAAKESLALDIKNKERQVDRIADKIKLKQAQLGRVIKAKDSLAARSRARKEGKPVPPYKNPFGGFVRHKVTADGLAFTVGGVHGKRPPTEYANEYLFEHQYLNSRVRTLKNNIHFMKDRLLNLKRRLKRLKREQRKGLLHICFGGKKILRQRQAIRKETVLRDWQYKWNRLRRREMLLAGRKDAKSGNFIARYDIASHTLRYKSILGYQIDIPNVVFPYGQEWVEEAVSAHDIALQNKKLPLEEQISGWKPGPVTWAIKDCGNAFLVKCMISLPEDPDTNYCFDNGCVAIDMNYDHFAVAETGPHGELLDHKVVPFQAYGRSSDQITNAISESLETIFDWAVKVKKPVAIEDIKHLDNCLLYGDKKANRKISQFAYDKMTYLAESKGQKYHLDVRKVNPAYTSQIGKFKYMRPLGLSVHEAAAYVIGRRAMGFQDEVPKEMFHLIPEKVRADCSKEHWKALYNGLKAVPVSMFYRKINYRKYETTAALKKALLAQPSL